MNQPVMIWLEAMVRFSKLSNDELDAVHFNEDIRLDIARELSVSFGVSVAEALSEVKRALWESLNRRYSAQNELDALAIPRV